MAGTANERRAGIESLPAVPQFHDRDRNIGAWVAKALVA
jgi:hypothetical protein